eukprot:355814-Chlamydomonas_euryale.AAC.5
MVSALAEHDTPPIPRTGARCWEEWYAAAAWAKITAHVISCRLPNSQRPLAQSGDNGLTVSGHGQESSYPSMPRHLAGHGCSDSLAVWANVNYVCRELYFDQPSLCIVPYQVE